MDLVPTIPNISSTLMPYRNRKVVIQLDQLMYLRESFKTIPEEHEINLMDYDEAMSTVDAYFLAMSYGSTFIICVF